jgi:hypothetical protein
LAPTAPKEPMRGASGDALRHFDDKWVPDAL